MRLVLEEMLRSTMSDGSISTMEELLTRLDHAASASNTSKLWVDCFIKPVFIVMLYVRDELESDWPFGSCKANAAIFYASPHLNYARYGILVQYCRTDTTREWLDTTRTGRETMVYGLYRSWINGDMHIISNTALQPPRYNPYDSYGS